jgi:hypothetical protein
MYTASAWPMVQWACNSSGLPGATDCIAACTAGISVRARFGVSRPPGSLM